MSGETSFWARRRAAVAAEADAEQAAVEAQAQADEREALEAKSDAEILAALHLPDPDTMRMGDDFAAFMSKAVPDRLRRRALRTLWRSDPVLANVDMLVDYGEDFTDSATVVENLQTAYQVGKGMLKHVEEMARQAEAAEMPAEPDVGEDLPDEPAPVAQAETPEVQATELEEHETPPVREQDLAWDADDGAYRTPTPRRMKFTVEETA